MGEVITDKDKEYEKMEREAAPGPDQAMSDRVNNRSLRPRSEAFKEFMTCLLYTSPSPRDCS